MGRGNLGTSTSLTALEPQDDSQKRGRERRGRREGWRVDRKGDTGSHCAPSDWKLKWRDRKERSPKLIGHKLDLTDLWFPGFALGLVWR